MGQLLKLANYPAANIVEETQLDADMAAGTSLTLKDNQGFASGNFVLIGQRGSEVAELRTVDTVNANLVGLTITAATKLSHDRFDQLTKLFGNKMKIYRAANVDGSIPSDASFGAVYATIDIDPDQTSTEYTDATGSTSYWYKRTFYNPTSLAETPIAEATAYRGFENMLYATPEQVRRKAGMKDNKWISDETIIEKIRAAMSVIDGTLTGLYTVPFSIPTNQIINEITQLLAAGYLLTQESTNRAIKERGEALIAQATNKDGNGWLDKLNKKEVKMVGITGDVQASTDSGQYNGWPLEATATADSTEGGGERMFRVSTRY